MHRLSTFISYFFHPIFLNFYVVVLFLFVHPYTASKMQGNARILHVIILFVNMVFLPLILLLFLKWRKLISSYQIPIRGERGLLYLMLGVLFGITTYQMNNQDFSYVLVGFIASMSVGLLVLYVINLKTKISMHAVSAGSAVGSFAYLVFFEQTQSLVCFLIIFLLIAGLIGSARLYLKAHNSSQVWLGYLVGFSITISILWIITHVLN